MHLDLEFIKAWGAYNVGEVARFAKIQAHSLIARGVALEKAVQADVENAVQTVLGAKAQDADPVTQGSENAQLTLTDAPEVSGSDQAKATATATSKGKAAGANSSNPATPPNSLI